MVRMPSPRKTSSKPAVNSVSIADQELDGPGTLGEFIGQIPGLLDRPCSRWVSRDSGHVHLPGVQLDEEQDVEPPEQHGVHGEEVASQHCRGLGSQELTPRRTGPVRRGGEAVALEDVPDTRRGQVDAQDRKLPVDPAIAPGRVLPGKADHHLDCPGGDPRRAGGLRIGPFTTHQLTMPTEQCVGLDEEPRELRSGDQPTEACEEGTIRWSQSRAGHLPSEDCHLVSEHDDLNGQIRVIGPLQAEDLDGPEEGEIEEREGHGPFTRSRPVRSKSQIKEPG